VARQPIAAPQAPAEVYDYVIERLRAYLLEGGGGATTEMFDAVLATRPGSPLDFRARLAALVGFLALPAAASLTAANKRIANILRKSGEAAPLAPGGIRPDLLREPAERALNAALGERRDAVRAAIAQGEYATALSQLAQLRPQVDAFFDDVMVMDPDETLRRNRLALLGELRSLFLGVADLSRLPG
jgi:glycyl-tRNA synthetase beta chain